MITEMPHMQSRRIDKRKKGIRTGCEKTAGTEIKHYARHYEKLSALCLDHIFYGVSQATATSEVKAAKRQETSRRWGRKLVEFLFATIPCIGVYVYILLRYSYRLQRRLAELPR